jgi:hypothetical protein
MTEPARHAERSAGAIDDDDRMHPIGFARATEIFERLAGAIRPGG